MNITLMLIVLNILNVTDAIFTAIAVKMYGASIELNPIMRFLIEKDMMLFIWVKIFLVGMLLWYLTRRSFISYFTQTTRIFISICTFWYVLVNVWHIYYLFIA